MIATSDKISSIIKRSILSVCILALIVGLPVLYQFLKLSAMSHVEDEARTIMRVAQAMRTYTSTTIAPVIIQLVSMNSKRDTHSFSKSIVLK